MRKQKRLQRLKWARRIAFGAIALGATFGAGYLAAGEKADPGQPKTAFLIPEGYKVSGVWQSQSGFWLVRAEDPTGITHVFSYQDGKGERKIRWHYVVGPVPAAKAFED